MIGLSPWTFLQLVMLVTCVTCEINGTRTQNTPRSRFYAFVAVRKDKSPLPSLLDSTEIVPSREAETPAHLSEHFSDRNAFPRLGAVLKREPAHYSRFGTAARLATLLRVTPKNTET